MANLRVCLRDVGYYRAEDGSFELRQGAPAVITEDQWGDIPETIQVLCSVEEYPFTPGSDAPPDGTDLSAIGTFVENVPAWGEPGFVDPTALDATKGWIALDAQQGGGGADVTAGFGSDGDKWAELWAADTQAYLNVGHSDGWILAQADTTGEGAHVEVHATPAQTQPLLILRATDDSIVFSVGIDGTFDPPILGGAFPDFNGSGSPEGVQTANVGQSYQDSATGAVYFKFSGSGNTGWSVGVAVAADDASSGIIGVGMQANGSIWTIAPQDAFVVALTDIGGFNNTGNGILWFPADADGSQFAKIVTGPDGEFQRVFAADGSTSFPGPLKGPIQTAIVADAVSGQVFITDAAGFAGTGNGLVFAGGAADGDQHLVLDLGDSSQYEWTWAADGSTSFPGDLALADGTTISGVGITLDGLADGVVVQGTGGILIQDTGGQDVRISAGGDRTFAADGSTSFPGPVGVNGVTPPAQADFIDPVTATAEQCMQILIDFGLVAAS